MYDEGSVGVALDHGLGNGGIEGSRVASCYFAFGGCQGRGALVLLRCCVGWGLECVSFRLFGMWAMGSFERMRGALRCG